MLKIDTSKFDELHNFVIVTLIQLLQKNQVWMDPIKDSISTLRDWNSRLSMSLMCIYCNNVAQLCELLFLQIPLQQILRNALFW
jgi:hypothetical protein